MSGVRNQGGRRVAAWIKAKTPQKKAENAKGDGEFFGEGETDKFGEIEEDEVEEDVVPLPGEVEAGSFALLDELGEPGVVGVAAEIAGLDVGMPEAGDEEKEGEEREDKDWSTRIGRHCRRVSIARMGVKNGHSQVTSDQWPVAAEKIAPGGVQKEDSERSYARRRQVARERGLH